MMACNSGCGMSIKLMKKVNKNGGCGMSNNMSNGYKCEM